MAVRKKISPVSFDAPATLIFSIISLLIFLLSREFFPSLISFFSAPSAQGTEHAFNWTNPLQYTRFLFHVLGNTSWPVFASDLAFILLLGPQLEQRFGSVVIMLMACVTALVSGLLNAAFSTSLLMGGTGIAFMMILLAAFTSIDKSSIPLSFLFAAVLFLFRELYYAVDTSSLSNFAHLAGGLAGSALGFTAKKPQSTRRKSPSSSKAPAAKVNKETPENTPVQKKAQTKNTQWEDVTTVKL